MGQNLELELLPIGSVVMFKDWEHPLMVYGRRQMDSETKTTWDYVCCYFPHGNISSEYNFFLNHEDISSVLHLGFINETELEFQKLFKKKLKKNSDSFRCWCFEIVKEWILIHIYIKREFL